MIVLCTLFDSNYFSRAMAMYGSLKKHCGDFRLYVFPFDEMTNDLLKQLKLENVVVIPLSDFENEELLRVKPLRTKVEYCWTAPPSMIYYVLENYHEPHCTYLDADVYFYNDPTVLIEEMGHSSIMLSEHRFTPGHDTSALFGKFCVQLISFKNDTNGLKALTWWKDACIDWCYDRIEDGKFADQKYLDEMSTRFEGVHILQHKGGGIAPWNVQQYTFNADGGTLMGIERSTGIRFPVIFYHFHYVRFFPDATIDIGDYRLSSQVVELLYKPYLVNLENIKSDLKQYGIAFDPHGPRMIDTTLRARLIKVKRWLYGRYNKYSIRTLIP
jgi:hypothetical protein